MKSLLYVEDKEVLRIQVNEYFARKGWDVDVADNGIAALNYLGSNKYYDVMILDLVMLNGMSGDDLLENIASSGLELPPTIMLSAHLSEDTMDKCRCLGVKKFFKKPYSIKELHEFALFMIKGTTIDNIDYNIGPKTINYLVKHREQILRNNIKRIAGDFSFKCQVNEPLFVVGRRWNSWYPSIFNVLGGAYAVVAPAFKKIEKNIENEINPIFIIDPGFGFIEIFKELGISVDNMSGCIISHNHPDHIGGIFEFMAARHAFGKTTKAFINPVTNKFLNSFRGFNFETNELSENYIDLIPPYNIHDQYLQIRLKAFDTYHEEIGGINSSKGIIFNLRKGIDPLNMEEKADVIIVGDTEYDHAEHHDKIIPIICRHNVKVIILHIGSSQLKVATGKHLYLNGLIDILNDIDSQLRINKYPGKLLVLVSEWGLEHATKNQIKAACNIDLIGFNDISPIKETIRCLQKDKKKIVLMPADIGLMIGMQTGNIYFENGEDVDVNNVTYEIGDNGIRYSKVALEN